MAVESHAEGPASPALSGTALTPPPGMRDLLPPESRARRRVSELLQGVFERYGYELVTTPLFEHVEVFERGLSLDHRDLVRFVEPDSGEVAALRPDITPQIARVVATRMTDYPPPYRLRYEGTVIRRRRGRARRQRQIAQVGVELIGLDGPDADLELVRLIAEAVEAVGLSDYRIELSEVGVGRALLSAHGEALLAQSAEALARKDEALLDDILRRARVPDAERKRIAGLAHLHGRLDVLKEARALLGNTAAAPHLAQLERVSELLIAHGLGDRLGVDLGEIRGAAYYTGVSFAVFAPGPGEAVASGGRYDQLLERYGRAQPATGAGIDLENLLWALDHAGHSWRERPELRFVVCSQDNDARNRAAMALREAGLIAASLPNADRDAALGYAKAWNYDVCIDLSPARAQAVRARDLATHDLGGEWSASNIQALAQWARAAQHKE
ncbi:MAG: ATP phosphoribosyltransferase regulatory subunit [Myxococcales bacterium]